MSKINQLSFVFLLLIFLVSCQNSVRKETSSISFDEPAAPQLVSPEQNWEYSLLGVQPA